MDVVGNGVQEPPAYPYTRKKADSKKVMVKHVPSCIISELPEGCKVGKVVRDDTILWRSFSDTDEEGNRKLGSDLIQYMIRDVDYWFKRGATTFVMRYDKYNYVPPTKAEEQARRSKRSDIEPLVWDGKSKLIELDKPVPDWKALYENARARSAARQQALQLMIEMYNPPDGKRLIIDGARHKNNDVPIVLRTTVTGDHCEPCYGNNFRNCIGESDYGMIFFARLFSTAVSREELEKQLEEETEDFIDIHDLEHWQGRPTDDILLITNDTDCIHASVFLQKLRQGEDGEFINNWFIYLNTREIDATGHPARPLKDRLSEEEKCTRYIRQYFNPNEFCRACSKLLKADNIQFAVESFIAAQYIGGGDYVDGYYGATYDHIATAYLRYAEHIGDLVSLDENSKYGVQVSGAAYANLLKFVFYCAYEKKAVLRLDSTQEPPKKRPSPNFIFEDGECIETASFSSIKRQIKRIKQNTPRSQLPHSKRMIDKLHRWVWYVMYVCSSHELDAHLLPDGKAFGWREDTDLSQQLGRCIYVKK